MVWIQLLDFTPGFSLNGRFLINQTARHVSTACCEICITDGIFSNAVASVTLITFKARLKPAGSLFSLSLGYINWGCFQIVAWSGWPTKILEKEYTVFVEEAGWESIYCQTAGNVPESILMRDDIVDRDKATIETEYSAKNELFSRSVCHNDGRRSLQRNRIRNIKKTIKISCQL